MLFCKTTDGTLKYVSSTVMIYIFPA